VINFVFELIDFSENFGAFWSFFRAFFGISFELFWSFFRAFFGVFLELFWSFFEAFLQLGANWEKERRTP
jgi:hypothetical protein